MKKILLCIPNISEGRNIELIGQVADAIKQVDGVKFISQAPDGDHNRTVFTYLGEPEAVLEASKAMATKAIELIDMTQHKGSHPRLGAVDVVPYVPLQNVKVKEAIAISKQFGQFLGEHGVPVFYYEDSAKNEERKSQIGNLMQDRLNLMLSQGRRSSVLGILSSLLT